MEHLLEKSRGKVRLKLLPNKLTNSIISLPQQFDQYVYEKIIEDRDREIGRLNKSYEEERSKFQKEIERLKEENRVLQKKINSGKVLDYAYKLEKRESDTDSISLLRYSLGLILEADTGSAISLSSRKLARFFNDYINSRKAKCILLPMLEYVLKEEGFTSHRGARIYHFTVTDEIKQRVREYAEKLGIKPIKTEDII